MSCRFSCLSFIIGLLTRRKARPPTKLVRVREKSAGFLAVGHVLSVLRRYLRDSCHIIKERRRSLCRNGNGAFGL